MSFQLLAYDHKLNLQWKSLKDIIRQFNETVIYAPTAHKMSENRQFLCPNLVSGKTGRSSHDSEEDGRYGRVLLTVKLHLPWFPSCQQPMCAVHVCSGHRCDCCAAVLIFLIGCTLLRCRQTLLMDFPATFQFIRNALIRRAFLITERCISLPSMPKLCRLSVASRFCWQLCF